MRSRLTRTRELRKADYWIALALSASVLVVFIQIVHHDFILYDDPLYVTENRRVQNGLTPEGVVWAFTTSHASNYWHPLTWLSHMLDCEVWGMWAGGHHLTNLLLHALNAALLFVLFLRMTGSRGRSAFVAVLFAMHPLHVESVAWIAERKDVLSTLFWILALLAYVRFVERPQAARYLLLVLFFTLGLLAKPMVVTLPFTLLLLDLWPLGRTRLVPSTQPSSEKGAPGRAFGASPAPCSGRRSAAWLSKAGFGAKSPRARTLFLPGDSAGVRSLGFLVREKLPLLFLSVLVTVGTLLAQPPGALASVEKVPVAARLANAVVTYATYVLKMFWPTRLSVFYPHHGMPAAWRVIVSLVVLVIISGFALALVRRRPYLFVGWSWYLGTLIPVIGLVQVGSQAMADRYTYLPLVGVFIMLAWGGWEVAETVRIGWRTLVPAVFVLVSMLGYASWRQMNAWRNSVTLFSSAIDATEANPVARNLLGNALYAQGRRDEALRHYEEAVRLRPNYDVARNNLGRTLADLGKSERALSEFSEALRLNPSQPEAHLNLGIALEKRGDIRGASNHFAQAIASRPEFGQALNNLAWIRATSPDAQYREPDEAVRLAEKACLLAGRADPGYLDTLAAAYAGAGRFPEAVATMERAFDLLRSGSAVANIAPYEERLRLYRQGIAYLEPRPAEGASWKPRPDGQGAVPSG